MNEKNIIRDIMLVTMGCRAGTMECSGIINLPSGVEGEDELAAFVCQQVDAFLNKEQDESFDCFIEDALARKYGAKLYAKQVAPDFQESPFNPQNPIWDGEYIAALGNREYREIFNESFKRLYDNVDDAAEYADILSSLGEAYLEGYYGMKSLEDILLKNGLYPEGEKNTYSPEELEKWEDLLQKWREHPEDRTRPHHYEDLMAEMYSMILGIEMQYSEIRGSGGQTEWQGLYHPADWTRTQLRHFEMEYWNEGTEWIVHTGDNIPDCPDDIDGHAYYCYGETLDEICRELVEATGFSGGEENVVLWKFERYCQVPQYTRETMYDEVGCAE